MSILTYNVPLETNLSYAQTFRRLINNTPHYKWVYGTYNYSGPIRDLGDYIIAPGVIDQRIGMPANLPYVAEKTNTEMLFIHDDIQKINWMSNINGIPTTLWLPWDNEDLRLNTVIRELDMIDNVIVVSKFSQDYFNKFDRHYQQIYNPIDTNTYHPDDELRQKTREHLKLGDDDIILTWVGRPGWRKRFFHIIEIGARLHKINPKIHLLLHTDFKDPDIKFRPEELLYARDVLGTNAIIWPSDLQYDKGYSEADMNGIYNATDIYIAPHGGEGMGIPICEAMACKKPFVATDYSTTQEFANYKERNIDDMIGTRGIGIKCGHIFEDKGVLRPYADLGQFVDKVLYLIENEDIRKKMGNEGRQFVVKEASAQVVGSKMEHLFDKITKSNGVILGKSIH